VCYVLTRLAKGAFGGHNDLDRPWLDWIQNLTLTQWVSLPFHPVADAPQNPKLLVAAFWSLNYEDQFYLVMAVALLLSLSRRVSVVVIVLALAAVGLLWNLAWPGGWITGFFIEYWVHFSLGAMLFYTLCLFPGRLARCAFIACVTALGLFCSFQVLPWHEDALLRQRAYAELVVVCGSTLFLFVVRPMSAWVARLHVWRPIAALGAISYSLYLVHQFNLTVVETLVARVVPNAWGGVRIVAMLGLEIAIATVFWYCCERPFLNRSLPRRGERAPGAAQSEASRPQTAAG
jgi:peptidoglycan/LPS O-acetylase OafA/YrhL